MLKTLRRIGAALIIAGLVLPQFVLAANVTPTSAACLDDQSPDDGTPETECVYNTGDSAPYLISDTIDGSTSTGVHVSGPNYPILFTVDLGQSYGLLGLNITGGPVSGWGGPGNRIAPTSTNPSNVIQYSANNVDWYSFGDIPAYDDDNDLTAEVTGSASARYLRIWNYETVGGAAGWSIAEITAITTGGGVPEMGLWALMVVLPIMFYVAYKSTPTMKGAAS